MYSQSRGGEEKRRRGGEAMKKEKNYRNETLMESDGKRPLGFRRI